MSLLDVLAAGGQMYGGYQDAATADQRLRSAAIAERLAALKQAEEERIANYNAKVSSGLQDFLPGGSKATVVQTPGEGAVIPATAVDDEGYPMPMDMGKAKPVSTENRMGALEFMHRAALEGGLPDKAEAYQKKIAAFKEEGLLDTAQAVLAGKSDDEIRDTFNRQGNVRLSRVQRIPGSKTQIVGITEDGKPVQFDAESAMRSALANTPDKFFNFDAKEKALTEREREFNLKNDLAGRIADEQGKRIRAQSDLATAQAELARARAGAAGNPTVKQPDPAKARAEMRTFSDKFEKLAKSEFTDPTDGKVNTDDLKAVVGLSRLLVEEDQDLLGDPRAALEASIRKLAELKAKAGEKAVREWSSAGEAPSASLLGGFSSGGGDGFGGYSRDGGKESKEDFVKRRSSEIIKTLLGNVSSRASSAAAPAPLPRVSNDEEWSALPSGTSYIGPDGQLRRKP